MITVKIRSLWHGQAGVHEKYVSRAMKDPEGLRITMKEEQMLIPTNKIMTTIKRVSEETFQDRFSGEVYRLTYFDWKPTLAQGKLL